MTQSPEFEYGGVARQTLCTLSDNLSLTACTLKKQNGDEPAAAVQVEQVRRASCDYGFCVARLAVVDTTYRADRSLGRASARDSLL